MTKDFLDKHYLCVQNTYFIPESKSFVASLKIKVSSRPALREKWSGNQLFYDLVLS